MDQDGLTRPPVMHVAYVAHPPLGWVAVCGVHGQLAGYCADQYLAAFNLMGHIAHHHTRPRP